MLYAILSTFLVAAIAPAVHRVTGRASGWVLGLLPAALFLYFLSFLPAVSAGESIVLSWPWLPGLDIHLSFLVDGLSLLFALLISGIGFFIVTYAGRYLEGHRDLGRFYVIILAFMGSMLGLVLADNLIAMFVFWELTSITSYLLIGYNHENADARKYALQGLIVTVGGGLALLAGIIMLAMAGGSYELSEILANGDVVREHALYLPLLILILIGAFTKSAQVPFHFWLPRAMAAPTPVSAYLHSATMVKAGVYLMARLNPSLGGTDIWFTTLALFGAITMFTGVFLAFRSTGVKQVLAYSTVMALGTLTMLIGIGTETALMAAMAFLLAHSLYKGALFMVAGILDHEAGAKDFLQTGGLRTALPITAAFAILAALSLGGVIPLFGFVAKELMLESVLEAPGLVGILTLLAVLTAILGVAVAAIVGIRPWFGARVETPKTPHHEAPPAMLAGPVVLASLGLIFGLGPGLADDGLVNAAAASVQGAPVDGYLALWHGINWPLAISAFSLVAGGLLYWRWEQARRALDWVDRAAEYGPEKGYFKMMDGLVWISEWQTRVLQNGYLRYYVIVIVAMTAGLVGVTAQLFNVSVGTAHFERLQIHEMAIIAILVASMLFAVLTRSRLGAVAALGSLGFTVALVYVLYSAADVGITQVLVETLTVILLVLVLFRLPGFLNLSSTALRLRDAGIALVTGGMITLLMLSTMDARLFDSISQYFIEESEPSGYGRNIVNVVLVDFRALDTLGEIFVLALAAIGVYAMIRFRAEDHRR
ncbi:NADH/Ubiquinone/plastoquinone (complex I) [Thioalkalivibrio sp. K90mix]|uniref:putative monovalent cation/H+ antiporter subunit A n=1 Tax=unclassified Thioalkalivibrio TaxID=2621013 RepID=UPI000195A8F3|nr:MULTISPECIES: putative monovalent cation/H+ antiporter subunit A [unclassified Thioalkalivibrio]ADC71263.1 NADH/Ubiquinone/plastoquinone (complex I) [Thioalkalivibrio sp. K90mix]